MTSGADPPVEPPPVCGSLLGSYDVNQVMKSVEVALIARVQPRRVRVSRRSDEQIHRSCSWLTASIDDCGSHQAVTRGHRLIEWQRVEFALEHKKSS